MEKSQSHPLSPDDNVGDLYEAYVAPMYDLLGELSRTHPDAYQAFGGQNAAWELEEVRPRNTLSAKRTLEQAYGALKELQAVANEPVSAPNRLDRLKRKVADFERIMWGV